MTVIDTTAAVANRFHLLRIRSASLAGRRSGARSPIPRCSREWLLPVVRISSSEPGAAFKFKTQPYPGGTAP